MAKARAVRRPKEVELPLLTCGRCGGSGCVPATTIDDFDVEDSNPREVPLKTCPTCGGMGQVRPKERMA